MSRAVDEEKGIVTITYTWEDVTKPAAIAWDLLLAATDIQWASFDGGCLRLGPFYCTVIGANSQYVYIMKRS